MYYYGNRTNLILIAAAVIPAIFLLRRIYRADRLEKEPRGLIVSLVFFGILSTVVALLAEELGMGILDALLNSNSFLYALLLNFVVVGGAEEGAKLLLLRLRTWKNPNFNCRFDAVVYAVTVSLGFALWENISYVAAYGFATALVRAVTAVPGHACFGVFMGVYYGLAKSCERNGDAEGCRIFRRRAFFIPAAIHGLYDFIAGLNSALSGLVFLAFIAVLFFLSLRMVKKQSAEDEYI